MDIRPIKNEADYQFALEEIERLFDAELNTPEGDRLEVLVTLVEAYEAEHHAIPLPDPIEAIEYHMESRGLSRRDLEPFIGSRARVSEILNRKRPLTLRMIRNLETGLGISAELLIQPYELAVEAGSTHRAQGSTQKEAPSKPQITPPDEKQPSYQIGKLVFVCRETLEEYNEFGDENTHASYIQEKVSQ